MSFAEGQTDTIGAAGQDAGRFAAQVSRRHGGPEPDPDPGEEGGPPHQDAPPRPALRFAVPAAPPASPSGPEPSQTATEESAGAGPKPAPGGADARAVADHVYELMKREIALGRTRGGVRQKGQ